MSVSSTDYCAWNHREWEAASLKDYGDFAECVAYVNQEEDGFEQLRGEWFADDVDALTIYWGSFGNYNSPGASSYTYACVYDCLEDFQAALAEWEAMPEYADE